MTQRDGGGDYHDVLGIERGNELAAFAFTVRRMLRFEEMAPEGPNELTALREAYDGLPEGTGRDFVGLLSAMRDSARAGLGDPVVVMFLLMDVRMNGSAPIPPEWTPDSAVMSIPSSRAIGDPRKWWIYLRDGVAYYSGQLNPGFDALRRYARDLFSRDAERDEAAMYLWDELGGCAHGRDQGAVIDGLTLAAELPRGHSRVERILEEYELLTAGSPGVRRAAACLMERHRLARFVETARDGLVAETEGMVAEAWIRALRAAGGEAAFDALLAAARDAVDRKTAKLAARALAWVRDHDGRRQRIVALCTSEDPDLQAIGAAALGDSKHHSVFSYGDRLATEEECRLRDGFRDLMEDRADDAMLRLLGGSFNSGLVRLATGEEATAVGAGPNGAIVATRDGFVLLILSEENLEAGRRAIERARSSA